MQKINIILKRLMDIIGSAFFLFIYSPIMLLSAFCLYVESGRPIFYSHIRLGKDRKEFNLLKIRSMVLNADELLWVKNPTLLEQYKKNGYKLKDDPRVTSVGRFLRRFDI